MTYVPAKFEVAMSNGLGDALPRKTLFDLEPKVKGVKVTENVVPYPPLSVTYAPAKFDVATSHG